MSGLWEIILPSARTNLVQNPTAHNVASLTAIGGGTVSRVTTYSYLGPACNRLVTAADNTGGYFTLTACANDLHYLTLRIHTSSDITPMFDTSLDNSTWTEPTLLSTEGDWKVYGRLVEAAEANGSTALRIQQKGAGNNDIYIGHAQVEQGISATTPITGDLIGFLSDGYSWAGSPHASSSSRSGQERSGGGVYDLLTSYGISVRWASGIGMPPSTHLTQGQALLPGMAFHGAKTQPRILDLTVVNKGISTPAITPEAIHSIRQYLVYILMLDRVKGNQPTKLRYRGALSTNPVDFNCYYDTGLGFDMGSSDFDQPTIRLICYDPYVYEIGEASAQLTTTQTVTAADYAAKKTNGNWSNITTNLNGNVYCFAKASDGDIYIGGAWAADISTAADGNGIGIIKYNPVAGTFASVGTGLGGNKDVIAMAVAPNGDLYITGDFLDAGGVAAADYCARWDGTNWNALGSGLGGIGRAVVFGLDGKVYFGGDFTNLTDANGDYITYWSGSAFVSMGTGMAGPVNGLCVGPNGYIYATGQFDTAGGVAETGEVACWNGSAWTAMGTGGLSGGTDIGYALAADKAGNIYVGGDFTAAGGVSALNIAKWNGRTWSNLGSGCAGGAVATLAFTESGLLLAGGAFTSVGGIGTGNRVAYWNGYTWAHVDMVFPGSPTVYGIWTYQNDIYVGYSTNGDGTSSYLNTVTNNGQARAYPVVHIKRSGGTSASVLWFKNETTGKTLYLVYSLLDGEELVLDFRLGRRKVTSSFFGSVIGRAILRGSEFSEFYLQPGANSISTFVLQVGSPTMSQFVTWTTTHESADGAAA